ncbi:MAG TPA: isoprenyl transferase [Candidatus Krumholzibacteria bacterium]
MTNDIDERIRALKATRDLPRHIAIIMDGNGRWAKKRHRPRIVGHHAGAEPVRKCVRACAKLGVTHLTLYTFSIENWTRPRTEVIGLMAFLEEVLRREVLELNENNVRLNAIGRLDALPEATRRTVDRSIEALAANTGLVLTLCLSYGGRAEIVDAARALASRAVAKEIAPGDIDETMFGGAMYDPSIPDPDLLIRTSGELRVSNFLLWQIAYSEIWVTDVLWPDFSDAHLLDAIEDYMKRERRYGGHA